MRVLDFLRPPLVALDVGTSAMRMSFGDGAVAETEACRRAMRGGVVTDVAAVAGAVSRLLEARRSWQRPAVLLCAPTDASAGERDALIEAVTSGGASVVAVVPEPLAAAIGSGVDVASEYATAVIDVGEGVTDFAVFRSGSMIWSRAMRMGCGSLRRAVEDWIGDETSAEALVRAWCADEVVPEQVEAAIEPLIDEIASFVARSIGALPSAVVVELIESGVCITGGGAKLERLVERIERLTRLSIVRAPDPLRAVIRGAGEMLRNRDLLLRSKIA